MAKNFFRKKSKDTTGNDWKATGSFIRKPTKGWLHADRLLETSGVTYETKYVGAVKITESMRHVPFGQRGAIVREAISICCAQTPQYNFKAKKVSLSHGIVGDVDLKYTGMSTITTISKSVIKAFGINTGEVITQHQIESISFSSIGEDEYKNMIGYVAKDPRLERACFIFESVGGLSDDIILTVGQAFELKYKEYINKTAVIQPVIGKFTDPGNMPVVNENEYDTRPAKNHLYSNHEVDEPKDDDEPGDYDHLFGKGKKALNSESEYNTLQHNNNSLISPTASSFDFATGASYMGRDAEIATVYDNPIAAVNKKRPPFVDDSNGKNDIYDNPNDTSPTENNNLLILGAFETKEQIYLSPKPVKEYLKPQVAKRPSNPPPRPATISGDIHKQPWFHGAQSRDQAERMIHQDGEFLVRESGNSSGQYVLTGMRNGTHRHLLLVDPNGKVRTRDNSFDTVPALIQYHMTHNIPISSGTSEVYLIHDVHDLSRDPASSFLI